MIRFRNVTRYIFGHGEQAFTLLEVLVSLVIMAVGVCRFCRYDGHAISCWPF